MGTCAVTDSEEPFETGICHPNYNSGKWVIVEMYNSKERAQAGHDKWVKILRDVSTCTIAKLCRALNKDC